MSRTLIQARGGRLVEVDGESPEEFLRTVRRALGRQPGAGIGPIPEVTSLSQDPSSVKVRAQSVKRDAEAMADDLLSQLEESAAQIGWTVTRSGSLEDAARRVGELARDLQVRSIVRSAHPVLERMSLEGTLADSGVELWVMAAEAGAEASAEEQRRAMRRRVVETDMGLTGVDYAIAETGSCVLMARRGVSRLAPLLPPVHVVIVEKGQVLPSMDELFTLQRWDFLDGVRQGYMNIISGPSRSADIEQTLVKGVHGPGDVYMILLG